MDTPRFTVPRIRTRQAILAEGGDDGDIRAALADGSLVRVRRGCYVEGPLSTEHALVAAVSHRMDRQAVFSHTTAAALWELPFLGSRPTMTHVAVPISAHTSRRGRLHQHPLDLADDEVVEHRGIRLTSLARTLVDVARTEGFRQGVVMADHALRCSKDPQALRAAIASSIDRCSSYVGVAQARRMAVFANPLAESPGESLTRIVFHEQGVPPPVLQLRIAHRLLGGSWGSFRTDFGWEDEKVVGEFDGKEKYFRYVEDGETPGDVLMREKRREEAIREAGWLVLRITWEDLQKPASLGRRVREILDARAGWARSGRA